MRLWKVYPDGKFGVAAWRNGTLRWKWLRRPIGIIREKLRLKQQDPGTAGASATGAARAGGKAGERSGGQILGSYRGTVRERLRIAECLSSIKVLPRFGQALGRAFRLHRSRGVSGEAAKGQSREYVLQREAGTGITGLALLSVQAESIPLKNLSHIGSGLPLPAAGLTGRLSYAMRGSGVTPPALSSACASPLPIQARTGGASEGPWVLMDGSRLIIRRADEITVTNGRMVIR